MRSPRLNISVPQNLKKRMDKVREPVNWSALACEAFERELGEIASRKETKKMTDVIQRLRASRMKGDSESKRLGREAGQYWAKDRAEAHELERLKRLLAGDSTTLKAILQAQDGAYSPGEILFFTISPENDKDRQSAKDFWEGYSDSEADDAALDADTAAQYQRDRAQDDTLRVTGSGRPVAGYFNKDGGARTPSGHEF